MLSLKDCIDYLDLNEEVLEEIAHHDHIPMMCALEEYAYIMKEEDGVKRIECILMDNMVEAYENHEPDRIKSCMDIYGKFVVKNAR